MVSTLVYPERSRRAQPTFFHRMHMDRSDLIDQYLAHLRVIKNYSSNTVDNYGRDLGLLLEFCEENDISNWRDLKAFHIRDFTAQLHLSGNSARTIRRKLSSCRSFLNYLLTQREIDDNPAQGSPAPKMPSRLPKALDIEQTQRLVEIDAQTPIEIRDKAIMELFYSSGMRLSELASLDLTSIDLNDGSARVVGKGNKTRMVPVGSHAAEAIKRWLGCRDNLAKPDEPALFVSKRGNRVSVRSIQDRLKHWASTQTVSTHVHPHMLRHSFASHILESSQDLRAVQELLGHKNISTTQIYTHLDFQHLASVYEKAHPRAQKKKD